MADVADSQNPKSNHPKNDEQAIPNQTQPSNQSIQRSSHGATQGSIIAPLGGGKAAKITKSKTGEVPDASTLVAQELASRSSRWPWLVVGLVLGALAAFGVGRWLDNRSSAAEDDEVAQVELAVADVERRDLLEQVDWVGTLSYGELVDVVGSTGTITSSVENGAPLNRGDVIAAIDEQPVVAIFGDRPLWRTVNTATEGVDVRLIETNLVALGYDPDETITIDNEYTANTADMVERWQEDIGREVTGVVDPDDVVVVPGPSIITSPAQVGSAASGVIAGVSSQRQVTDVASGLVGTISSRASIGSRIEHGTVLYLVDDEPVVALLSNQLSDPVADVLTSNTFTDQELEQALADEGYDPDEAMTIDGVVTDATTDAIRAWQSATDIPDTGSADPGHYVVVPSNRTVETHFEGDRLALSASTSELEVSVVVAVADADEFEVGDQVSIELADESLVDGQVAVIGPVEEAANQDGEPTVTISIEVLSSADVIEGTVTVSTIGEAVEGAIAVPTRALVALKEGGFAVEVAEDSGDRTLVGVELGAFDDGYVEITEGGIEPGDQVVVPK